MALPSCVAFVHAKAFNGDISKWDTGNVENMHASKCSQSTLLFTPWFQKMCLISYLYFSDACFLFYLLLPFVSCAAFNGAEDFNGDISKWNTNKVDDMSFST